MTAKTVTTAATGTAATTAMTATTVSPRLLPVPEGLSGERVDVALSRMTGLSRSKVGDLCSLGAVRLDGTPAGKSDRVAAGAMIEADLRPNPPSPCPRRWRAWSCFTRMRTSSLSISLPG